MNDKNYQILNFWDGHNDIWRLSSGKYTKSMQYMYEEEDLLKYGYKITRVKRLSDDMVFESNDCLCGFRIKEFKIIENRLHLILS